MDDSYDYDYDDDDYDGESTKREILEMNKAVYDFKARLNRPKQELGGGEDDNNFEVDFFDPLPVPEAPEEDEFDRDSILMPSFKEEEHDQEELDSNPVKK